LGKLFAWQYNKNWGSTASGQAYWTLQKGEKHRLNQRIGATELAALHQAQALVERTLNTDIEE